MLPLRIVAAIAFDDLLCIRHVIGPVCINDFYGAIDVITPAINHFPHWGSFHSLATSPDSPGKCSGARNGTTGLHMHGFNLPVVRFSGIGKGNAAPAGFFRVCPSNCP
ncbi:MAG: hypothetical protein PHW78_01915 [Macromonas bipunctata]|nr:hypothetical protein [Macromonas bipunctata]